MLMLLLLVESVSGVRPCPSSKVRRSSANEEFLRCMHLHVESGHFIHEEDVLGEMSATFDGLPCFLFDVTACTTLDQPFDILIAQQI